MQRAWSGFKDANIKITTECQRHLCAVVGSETLMQKYVRKKRNQWIK